MAHSVDRRRGQLWFITQRNSAKAEEISATPEVCITVSDLEENRFASVSGTAELLDDAPRKRELWTPAFNAYFPSGPTDPEAVLLGVTLHRGEYWKGQPAPLDAIQTLLSEVTDERPDLETGAGQEHSKSKL